MICPALPGFLLNLVKDKNKKTALGRLRHYWLLLYFIRFINCEYGARGGT